MKRVRRSWSHALAFLAGAGVTSALIWSIQNAPARLQARLADDCGPLATEAEARGGVPREQPSAKGRDDEPIRTSRSTAVMPVIGADSLADLHSRALMLPVKGMKVDDLQESFDDKRGEGRRHEAIDILAPRNTPVLAVEDGTIARLFTSKAGGLTVYQFDPASRYAYYYAHLERYAPGLTGGAEVRRGQLLGFVGTSGNAPPDTPHLHFAIYRLNDKKQWWQGTPIDPYMVLRKAGR
ncbi:MAG TPA: M23 family metallopeptidase [Vicinamibacterales bacterium]|nr:M23 family metallopeptidase [Vicinamibacterales bacterium]